MMSQASSEHRESRIPESQPQQGDAVPPTLVLLDGHALFHRSFHAFPEEMSTTAGEPTNAIFGFTRMVLDVLKFINPQYLALTFDRPTPTFRHKEYAPYK